MFPNSDIVRAYSIHLENKHNEILDSVLLEGSYTKLYTYRHLMNGFAIHMNPLQVYTMWLYPELFIERTSKI